MKFDFIKKIYTEKIETVDLEFPVYLCKEKFYDGTADSDISFYKFYNESECVKIHFEFNGYYDLNGDIKEVNISDLFKKLNTFIPTKSDYIEYKIGKFEFEKAFEKAINFINELKEK